MKRPVPSACESCRKKETCQDRLTVKECKKHERIPSFMENVRSGLAKRMSELDKMVKELRADPSFSEIKDHEIAQYVAEGSESAKVAIGMFDCSKESKDLFVRTCSAFHDVKKMEEFLDVYRWH